MYVDGTEFWDFSSFKTSTTYESYKKAMNIYTAPKFSADLPDGRYTVPPEIQNIFNVGCMQWHPHLEHLFIFTGFV